MTILPLKGIRVLDFSQYLAGPATGLRLADLGAEVIKVEAPNGDQCRWLSLRGQDCGNSSQVFKTINRNKTSVTANLKDPDDLEAVRQLIQDSDVLIQNFRPGVIERLGLGYEDVKKLNPRIIYASVSGFGLSKTWMHRPGQDLLAQATAGIPWLNGSKHSPPTAVGISMADVMTAQHLTQGVLACLVRRSVTGEGGLVEASLVESLLDLTFEGFTAYLNTDEPPKRGEKYSAHPEMSAPYGVYETAEGYFALAMMPMSTVADLLGIPELTTYDTPLKAFESREIIVPLIADRLMAETAAHWEELFLSHDAWCAKVYSWPELVKQPAFDELEMTQTVHLEDGSQLKTTRCPIRIDGEVLRSPRGAPMLGKPIRETQLNRQES